MSESEFKEDDNETEHNSTAAPHRNETKKKRKKRKKRSGTGKHGAYHRSSEDNADVNDPFIFESKYFSNGFVVIDMMVSILFFSISTIDHTIDRLMR